MNPITVLRPSSPEATGATAPAPLRTLAHKACESQVLLAALDGDDVHVRIPRAHRVVETGRRDVPLVLLIEALRQAGFAFIHARLGIAADVSFLLDETSFTLPSGRIPFPEYGPAELVFRMRVSAVTRRGGRFDAVVRDSSGAVRGRGRATTRWLTRAQYAAVRRGAPVAVEERMERGHVPWHLDDPFFFDHPVDHLPGMLLVAATTERTDDAGGTWRFPRFAELDAPVSVLPAADGLQFLQRGEVVVAFSAEPAMRPGAV